jgi:hypothetical protein
MKSSNMKFGSLAAIALMATTFLTPAHADPVISLNIITPASGNVAYNGAVSVDIVVSGLTQAIGGYGFNLSFDATRLAFVDFLEDPTTKMGDVLNPAFPSGTGLAGSTVNFNVLSGFYLDEDEDTLAGIQGTGFVLGRLNLTALTVDGFAGLTLSGFSLSNYLGTAYLPVTATNGSVCVTQNGQGECGNVIPEPTTAWLVAVALAGLALRPRRAA